MADLPPIESTWRRELTILRVLATADEAEESPFALTVPEIARRAGFDENATNRSLDRLRRLGYIEAEIAWSDPPQVVRYLGITVEGLRESGMLPKRRLDAADVLALVDELVEQAPPEERSRWEQLRAVLAAARPGLVAALAARIIERATGLG